MITWVEWIEPFGPNNEPVYMSCPASTAIAVQKEGARKTKGFQYETDMEALADFVAVNWATLKIKEQQ